VTSRRRRRRPLHRASAGPAKERKRTNYEGFTHTQKGVLMPAGALGRVLFHSERTCARSRRRRRRPLHRASAGPAQERKRTNHERCTQAQKGVLMPAGALGRVVFLSERTCARSRRRRRRRRRRRPLHRVSAGPVDKNTKTIKRCSIYIYKQGTWYSWCDATDSCVSMPSDIYIFIIYHIYTHT